jgi:hypothetical protein
MVEKSLIHDLYIRIAKDSNFQIDAIEVAKLTANILKIHPLEVAWAFPYIYVMREVAAGTHPAVNR